MSVNMSVKLQTSHNDEGKEYECEVANFIQRRR